MIRYRLLTPGWSTSCTAQARIAAITFGNTFYIIAFILVKGNKKERETISGAPSR